MWRSLNEDEKNILLNFYKGGRTLVRGFFGIWLSLGVVFLIMCLYSIITTVVSGKMLDVIPMIFGMILLSGIFIVFPIACMKNVATSEIKAIENNQAFITEGYYLGSRRIVKRKDGKRRVSYRAVVGLFDGYVQQTIECRFMGDNPDNVCYQGEVVYVYTPGSDNIEDFLCFKK